MGLPRRLTRSVLAVGALMTVAVGVLLIAWPEVVAVQAAGRWGQSLAEGAGAVACALCARGLDGRRARATWALFAAGLAIWSVTDLLAGAWVMSGREIAPPSPFDVTWLLFYVPMLGGLGLLYAYMRPERSWQGMIDAALLSLGVAIFGWVLLLAPVVATATGGALGTIVNLLYPVFDLAGLGALAWVLLRRSGAAPPWLWWVAAAFGLTLTADIAYLTVYANGWTPAGGIAAAGYMAGGWLWVGAAGSRSRSREPGPDALRLRGATPAWAEGLPFVCGLAVVLLVVGDHGALGLAVLLALALAGVRLALTHRANRGLIAARREQERRLREVVDQHASLRRVAEAVAAGAEPEGLFGLVAGEVSALFGADCGLVWRFEQGEAEAVGVRGEECTPVGSRIALTGSGAVPAVARTRRSAVTAYAPGEARDGRIRHGIASPVTVDGRLWGCVHIAATRQGVESPFGAEGAERLEGFAALVGLAIGNAAARSEMETRALTDPLTGLANRRAFQERLHTEWERARRHGEDLTLVMIDLDHFKRVNDTHGHMVGDRVLVEFARRLRRSIRGHDVLARVGGEEFAWVLPGAGAAEAAEAAERARVLVRASAFPEAGRLTASFGVCGSLDASGASELHQLADEALYAAKREGRDRVCRYSPAMRAGAPPAAAEEPHLLPRPSVVGVVGLARAVDAKDPATRRHSGRVADLAVGLATAMGWDVGRCALLRDAGLMHDVGKIAVPDAILLKPGPLTPEEYAVVQTHAAASAAIVADVLSPEQVAWVRHHHERLDGTGYPDRLAAGEIPDGARILAVADAVDAMLTPRPYGRRMDLDEAVEECRRCAGTQFDPRVVDALERLVAVGAVDTTSAPAPA